MLCVGAQDLAAFVFVLVDAFQIWVVHAEALDAELFRIRMREGCGGRGGKR